MFKLFHSSLKKVDKNQDEGYPFIVVGLGNPGEQYAYTRHNVGFHTVDILSEKWGIVLNKNKHRAHFGEGRVQGKRVILSKPQTYMNNSGESVINMISFYKAPVSNLIVIYDDIDIELGRLRVRPEGSAGTHNGMRSIIYQLRNEKFPRVRIGIGPKPVQGDLANFVLSRFRKEEEKVFFQVLTNAAQAVETIMIEGAREAMNCFNGK